MKFIKEVKGAVEKASATIPNQRLLFSCGYSFSSLPIDQQMVIWDKIWHQSDHHHAMNQAFFFIESHAKNNRFLSDYWQLIFEWQSKVTDWPHCDSLAKIFTRILELKEKEVLQILKEWNQSENLWYRRQSMVTLLYYSRTKKKHLPYKTIVSFIKPLLKDEEYYVQKGLGWTLRELYNVYPVETLAFINDHLYLVSPLAYTAATEKIDKKTKANLNKLRADRRETTRIKKV